MQLYRKMREGIVSGAWASGARLPSKRTLAAENGVSVVTVQHALSLLCDEGYAESRERSGHYVIYRAGDLYALPEGRMPGGPSPTALLPASGAGGSRAEAAPQDAPAAGDVPHFPFSVLTRAMRKVMAEQGEKLLVKSPNSGLPELKADFLRRY